MKDLILIALGLRCSNHCQWQPGAANKQQQHKQVNKLQRSFIISAREPASFLSDGGNISQIELGKGASSFNLQNGAHHQLSAELTTNSESSRRGNGRHTRSLSLTATRRLPLCFDLHRVLGSGTRIGEFPIINLAIWASVPS